MLKELPVAGVRLPLDAVNCLAPVTLILRSLNVASPEALVICVVVPSRVPVPLLNVIVIGMFGSVTLLLLLSCNCTVTAGVMVCSTTVSVGCCEKTTLVAVVGGGPPPTVAQGVKVKV
jgi:hypothetical protein